MGAATRASAPKRAAPSAKTTAKTKTKAAAKAAMAVAPAPRARRVFATGPERATPCKPCMEAAMQNKSTGFCYSAVGSSRCVSCANNSHKCPDAPAGLLAPFLEYRDALNNKASEVELTRLRVAFKATKNAGGSVARKGKGKGKGKAVEVEDEEDEDFAAAAQLAGEHLRGAAALLYEPEEDNDDDEIPAAESSAAGAARGAGGAAAGGILGIFGGFVGGVRALNNEEQRAAAARVDELCEVIGGALACLAKEALGIPY